MPDIEHILRDFQHTLARYPQKPRLLAVSKTQPAALLEQAYLAGQRAFGENYVQEGCTKITALRHLPNIEWHFIGPIQSNKCKHIAEHFHWVQSLDRLKIAALLNQHCPPHKRLQVCIQVNIDNEAQKAGIAPEALLSFCEALLAFPQLQVRGLMVLPKAGKSIGEQDASFARIAQHFAALQAQFPAQTIDTLSMGMSDDYLAALKHGSTLIRIGSAIFGERT